jgi:hypothetical protein
MRLRDPACVLPFDRDPQLAGIRARAQFFVPKTPGEHSPKSSQIRQVPLCRPGEASRAAVLYASLTSIPAKPEPLSGLPK